MKKLGDVVGFKVTNSFSRENLNYQNGIVKNIHYGDIHTKFQTLFDITKEDVPYINSEINISKIAEENFCKEGDIIFADASEDLDDVGKTIEILELNNEKLLAGLHTILARPKSNIFKIGFSGYLFKSKNVRGQIKKEAQGSKVLSISATRVLNIELCFPTINEQEKVAGFLSLVEERIQTQSKIIERIQTSIQSLRENILNQKLKFKDYKGKNFSDWQVKELGEICTIVMGQSPDSNAYNTDGIGIPLIQGNADIQDRISVPRNYTSKITKECFVGDLILTVRAPVGAIAKSAHNACVGRGVCAIRNSSNVTNIEFLYQFFVSYESQWASLEQGSTFTSVSSIDIKKIKIPHPTIKEQTFIANFLSSVDKKIETEKKILEQYENQKKYLLQNMFI